MFSVNSNEIHKQIISERRNINRKMYEMNKKKLWNYVFSRKAKRCVTLNNWIRIVETNTRIERLQLVDVRLWKFKPEQWKWAIIGCCFFWVTGLFMFVLSQSNNDEFEEMSSIKKTYTHTTLHTCIIPAMWTHIIILTYEKVIAWFWWLFKTIWMNIEWKRICIN